MAVKSEIEGRGLIFSNLWDDLNTLRSQSAPQLEKNERQVTKKSLVIIVAACDALLQISQISREHLILTARKHSLTGRMSSFIAFLTFFKISRPKINYGKALSEIIFRADQLL